MQTTDYGHLSELFSKISNFWAWADILGWNILRHLRYFWPDYQHPFWYCESIFSIRYFYKKSKPLYPTPKYLFGSGIWIWAAKNVRFSLRVSVVRASRQPLTCRLTRVQLLQSVHAVWFYKNPSNFFNISGPWYIHWCQYIIATSLFLDLKW